MAVPVEVKGEGGYSGCITRTCVDVNGEGVLVYYLQYWKEGKPREFLYEPDYETSLSLCRTLDELMTYLFVADVEIKSRINLDE